MPDRTRAVLFDAVGTLFRVRGSVGAVYAEIAARHGFEMPAEVLDERFTAVFPNMPPLCFPGVPPSALAGLERRWWHWLVEQVIGADVTPRFETFFAELWEHFASANSWELYPETIDSFDKLKARGLRLAIVSNSDARMLRVCDELKLTQRVHAMLVSGRVGFAKPDPRIFHAALRRLGIAAPQAVHVGDHEREDIAGASAAGLRTILVRRKSEAPTTSEVISSLSQLLDLV